KGFRGLTVCGEVFVCFATKLQLRLFPHADSLSAKASNCLAVLAQQKMFIGSLACVKRESSIKQECRDWIASEDVRRSDVTPNIHHVEIVGWQSPGDAGEISRHPRLRCKGDGLAPNCTKSSRTGKATEAKNLRALL